jgi:hypothetical protein|nr:MAG TPA_asm: hypothetical protein [Caudoviricetes sp.]
MAKGCLDKLDSNILFSCDIPVVGVKDIYLVSPEDVTLTFSDSNRQISAISFKQGTRSYKVEGYKQNIQVTASPRTLDASQKLDVSIMFKSISTRSVARLIAGGRYYVLVVPSAASAGAYAFWGANSPLECTGFEYDSNANGALVTVTMSAPEGSAGNNYITCYAAVKDSIIAKSV